MILQIKYVLMLLHFQLFQRPDEPSGFNKIEINKINKK